MLDRDVSEILRAWPGLSSLVARRQRSGLINPTWILHGASGPEAVLQRLNTEVFDRGVHENIEAVTARLAERGVGTPRLIRTASGDLDHIDSDGAVWRVLSYVGDRTVERVDTPEQAESAAALVARFHAATEDLDVDFRPLWSPVQRATGCRNRFHDTPAYMAYLERAAAAHPDHRLAARAAPVIDGILEAWSALTVPEGLPERVVHGDLKISNIRFLRGAAWALIDLDTLTRGALDAELGDALRSWCNRSGEDAEQAVFDRDIFDAALRGYTSARPLTPAERESILPGVRRICLELAARFAADALEESYFGWDPRRYESRGEHNLVRARGQLALARAVRG